MAFGQPSGSPASHKQLQHLEVLLRQAGHDGFRDARGPLGLTQRQAGGRFTKDEASTLIDQLLQLDADGEPANPGDRASAAPTSAADRLETERVQALRGMPASLLADELVRRGWVVRPP